jgi:hypothetical protein
MAKVLIASFGCFIFVTLPVMVVLASCLFCAFLVSPGRRQVVAVLPENFTFALLLGNVLGAASAIS